MLLKRQKYIPKLPDFLSLCERNYAQLSLLLPVDAGCGSSLQLCITQQHLYQITIIDQARFTTTIAIKLVNAERFFQPSFTVRLYHDAQVAEVLACQNVSQLKPRYDYPNCDMLLPDEKRQINMLLRDWLKLCKAEGFNVGQITTV